MAIAAAACHAGLAALLLLAFAGLLPPALALSWPNCDGPETGMVWVTSRPMVAPGMPGANLMCELGQSAGALGATMLRWPLHPRAQLRSIRLHWVKPCMHPSPLLPKTFACSRL